MKLTMNIEYDNFFEKLVEYVPEFRTEFQEDVRLHGEVINHVFMGDFFAFVMAAFQRSRSRDRLNDDIVRRSLSFLENAMGSPDPRVRELIGVSFLEGIENVPGY